MSTAVLETPATVHTDLDFAASEEGDFVFYRFGAKTFRLDKTKARARLAGKRVINGQRNAELKFCRSNTTRLSVSIYKQMKANHWEPDVIDMTRDSQQWNTSALTAKERWIIEMGVGYFSAAEGIVGDSVLHVIEDNLTAAELKHASLRHIAEESVHMDSLLHIIGSLNILPALFGVKRNPFAWLDEVIFLRKEKNFFETRVTEYQSSGSVKNASEDDLI